MESSWDINTYILEWLWLIIPTAGEDIKHWNSHIAGGKAKWYSQVWEFLIKLNTHLTYDSAITRLHIIQETWKHIFSKT